MLHAPSPRSFASDAIDVSRLLCILGVIYVHAWTGVSGAALAAQNTTPQGWLRWSLVELLGRSAVPLLGMISGWLVSSSASRRPYASFVLSKIRTLAAPMVVWNAMAMTLVCGAALLGWLSAPRPRSLVWILDELFCFSGPNDVNVQMYFLRDLFVCMLAAPLLVRAADILLWLVVLATAVVVIGDWPVHVLIRPQILLFFVLGILARRRDWAAPLGRLSWAMAAAPFGLLGPAKIVLSACIPTPTPDQTPWISALDLALRLSASLLMWRAASALARSQANDTLQALAPLAFLIFCSHMTIIWLAGPLIGLATGPIGSPAYPLFLILQPPLILVVVIGLRRVMAALSPRALAFLSGRRDGPQERAARGAEAVTV